MTSNVADDIERYIVLRRIEETCDKLSRQLDEADGTLSFSLHRRRTIQKTAKRQAQSGSDARVVEVCFPGNTAEDAWRFTVVVRLLQIIREALSRDTIITKRDIYYRDPALFGRQAVVDRYVEDLALTFSVPRAQLNVSAAAKGLFRGPVIVQLKDGSRIDASASQDGILMPEIQAVASVDMSSVQWILVIEKEATFRSLLSSMRSDDTLAEGVIITAKGYPDVATRLMLQVLSTPTRMNNHSMPSLHALMDFDPDGFGIYSNYKYGSIYQAEPTSQVILPGMQLLGLSAQQINPAQTGSMLPLTARDRRRASKMLEHDPAARESQVRLDLQRMLALNIKVELQHLDSKSDELCQFIRERISS